MKLSIVVPVYNMAADGKLEYCIQSLLAQTAEDYEIIAVDDASTDDSLMILKKLEKEHPDKLRVIHSEENRRQGGAKNIGIRAARGEWLGFADSDDWAAPDMYAKLLKKAESTGADVVGCDYSMVYEQTMEIGEVQQDNNEAQTGILNEEKYRKLILEFGSMVIKIYKREIIVNNNLWFPEHIFFEDNCMSPLWLLHCTHFERVEEPLYYYYQHEASTVHEVSLLKLRDRMSAMKLLVEKSREYGFYEKYHPELEFKYAELYLVNTLFSCMSGKTGGKYGFVKELVKGIRESFPDFRENPYYKDRIGKEEQKLINMLLQSEALFFLHYNALRFYRKMKKGLRR